MISSAEFLASEQAQKLPNWVREHPDWNLYPTIDKAFPGIGLVNCREPYTTEVMDYGDSDIGVLKKMDICFSSDGIEGMWDIATMSMRGAMSCRHWDNPRAKARYNIVADMTSPILGIIYLTDGSMTEYGLSMNKRALIRLERYLPRVPGTAPDVIYMDRIYMKTTNRDPLEYVNNDPISSVTREVFKYFLRNKLNSKARAHTVIR
jgi:hypothetical protein